MIFFGIIAIYSLLIFFYSRGFHRSKHNLVGHSRGRDLAVHSFSMLIAVRNPSDKFQYLQDQLQRQINDFSDVEIIIIDDFSNHPVEAKFKSTRVLSLMAAQPELSSYTNNKKEAIELGVANAKGSYIVCLDADVEISQDWFHHITNYIDQYNPKFLAAIHRYSQNTSFLGRFLSLEQDVLTAISIGSLKMGYPTMCNGANMAFEKKAFEEVGGYQGLHAIAGGDDLFLLHRMYHRYPDQVDYLKNLEAAVYSDPPVSIQELFIQRNRWLGKTFSYENGWVLPQMVVILLANIIVLTSTVLIFFHPKLAALAISIKFLTDILFIYSIRRFYRIEGSLWKIILFVLLYPIYASWIGLCILLIRIYFNKR